MAVSTLNFTRYGFGITYGETAGTKTVKRTYNGVNFATDTAQAKANTLTLFVTGKYPTDGDPDTGGVTPSLSNGLKGIADALGLGSTVGMSIVSYEIIQQNTVTAT